MSPWQGLGAHQQAITLSLSSGRALRRSGRDNKYFSYFWITSARSPSFPIINGFPTWNPGLYKYHKVLFYSGQQKSFSLLVTLLAITKMSNLIAMNNHTNIYPRSTFIALSDYFAAMRT